MLLATLASIFALELATVSLTSGQFAIAHELISQQDCLEPKFQTIHSLFEAEKDSHEDTQDAQGNVSLELEAKSRGTLRFERGKTT